jgi:hypothetical protein
MNPSKRIQSRIQSKNIRNIFIPTNTQSMAGGRRRRRARLAACRAASSQEEEDGGAETLGTGSGAAPARHHHRGDRGALRPGHPRAVRGHV